MSVLDAFGLEPSAFICNGQDIIDAAKAVSAGPSSSAVKRDELEQSGPVSSPFFNPKRFKSKLDFMLRLFVHFGV